MYKRIPLKLRLLGLRNEFDEMSLSFSIPLKHLIRWRRKIDIRLHGVVDCCMIQSSTTPCDFGNEKVLANCIRNWFSDMNTVLCQWLFSNKFKILAVKNLEFLLNKIY